MESIHYKFQALSTDRACSPLKGINTVSDEAPYEIVVSSPRCVAQVLAKLLRPQRCADRGDAVAQERASSVSSVPRPTLHRRIRQRVPVPWAPL